MRLDKKINEEGNNSAEATSAYATEKVKCVPTYKKQQHRVLDSAGVVRDVEKLPFCQNSRNLGDGNWPRNRRSSFLELPIAKFFSASFRRKSFSTATGDFHQLTSTQRSTHSLSLTSLGSTHSMTSRHDRPNHLALSHCREARRRRNGCGLQGRRPQSRTLRRPEVPT